MRQMYVQPVDKRPAGSARRWSLARGNGARSCDTAPRAAVSENTLYVTYALRTRVDLGTAEGLMLGMISKAARDEMRRRQMKTAPMIIATMLLALLASAGAASAEIRGWAADTGLRVEWAAEQTKRGGIQISGYVYNERDQWAANPRLLVESLDAAGQVTASTLVYAVSDVPPRSRSYFEVPVTGGASTYRVTVRYVDWRGYGAAGG